MREVGIRRFRSKISEELKELPFALTSNGLVVAIVVEPEGLVIEKLKIDTISVPDKEAPAKKKVVAVEVQGVYRPYPKDQQTGKKDKK